MRAVYCFVASNASHSVVSGSESTIRTTTRPSCVRVRDWSRRSFVEQSFDVRSLSSISEFRNCNDFGLNGTHRRASRFFEFLGISRGRCTDGRDGSGFEGKRYYPRGRCFLFFRSIVSVGEKRKSVVATGTRREEKETRRWCLDAFIAIFALDRRGKRALRSAVRLPSTLEVERDRYPLDRPSTTPGCGLAACRGGGGTLRGGARRWSGEACRQRVAVVGGKRGLAAGTRQA